MEFVKENVCTLFSNEGNKFMIPDYQRAYSWENDQYSDFFNDLYEQTKGDNLYFLGNILVEDNKNSQKMEIIDGQQRITTILIFMRAIINVLNERKKLENISLDLAKLENIFFGINNDKFTPTNIDRRFFNEVIIQDKNIDRTTSKSQVRIRSAKKYFIKKIRILKDTNEILKLLDVLQKSIITITKIDNKTDSAFMFELQNNRGKEITAMEQVKAYLMYQVYINQKNNSVDESINDLSQLFEDIYLIINNLHISEDDLLWYHCNAYYGYSHIDEKYDSIKEFLREEINNIIEKEKKIEFIKDFVLKLRQTFIHINDMENTKSSNYLKRLKILGIDGYLYPFIINGYKHMKGSNKSEYLDKFFHIIEILAFRVSLIRTNGNVRITKRLDETMLNFDGNLNDLYNKLKNCLQDGNEWRWNDEAMKTTLNEPAAYDKLTNNIIHYILKVYENLELKNELPKLKNIWIEHISPKTPPKNAYNCGYELTKQNKYSKKFGVQYLNCLGNLILSTDKQNRDELSNENFSEKLNIYKNNKLGLKQQKELEHFFEQPKKVKWGIAEIEGRQKKIVEFAMKEWSFYNTMQQFVIEE
jgi:uncharacterized protein with ParB-like and HNH nuclease domain